MTVTNKTHPSEIEETISKKWALEEIDKMIWKLRGDAGFLCEYKSTCLEVYKMLVNFERVIKREACSMTLSRLNSILESLGVREPLPSAAEILAEVSA